MFKVSVEWDDHFASKAWLRVTHNGSSWSTIPVYSQDEINQVIEALQTFTQANKACTGQEPAGASENQVACGSCQ